MRVPVFGAALLLAISISQSAFSQSKSNLPPCSASIWVRWHLCFGEITYLSGTKYVGEFRDGKANGQGTSTHKNGEKYVGEHRDSEHNGWGTYTWADGTKYVGEFRNDQPNGRGTLTFPDGRKYVGGFRDGKRNGQGTYTSPNGPKYVGEWHDGKFYGQGTLEYTSGSKYVGEWRDAKRNGQGTYTSADGRKYVGDWRDGKRYGFGKEFDASGRVTYQGYWVAGTYFGKSPPPSMAGTRVKLVKEGGTYAVPVLINGTLTLNFTVDSGASDVMVPADVVITLMRTGTITDKDFIGKQRYRLADGRTIDSRLFIIRSLKVGNKTVRNVRGSVAGVEGSLLLGQSFLGKFKSWSMDNTRHELVLE